MDTLEQRSLHRDESAFGGDEIARAIVAARLAVVDRLVSLGRELLPDRSGAGGQVTGIRARSEPEDFRSEH